jgi:hypothetical protein
MRGAVVRAGVCVAIATIALGLLSEAQAAAESEAPSPPQGDLPQAQWDVRLNAGLGYGQPRFQTGLTGCCPGARVGLDAEYWLSTYVGVGLQVGVEGLSTIRLDVGGADDSQASASQNAYTIAPALTLRGSNPRSFPFLSVAVGYSWGHSEFSNYCDPDYLGTSLPRGQCMETYDAKNESGLYGSAKAAWLFRIERGTSALTLGPMVRLDVSDGWLVTTGIDVGFGYASPQHR